MGELLAQQASRDPGATAVVSGRSRVSYAELAARTGELAARLTERGAGPESRVGLLVGRGVDLVVAVFAVLEAGAAYVPVEPGHPRRHRAALLADAGVRLVVTHPERAGELPDGCEPVFVAAPGWDGDSTWPMARALGDGGGTAASRLSRPRIRPDNLAYVLYTSGSTGRPRGVLGTHRGLLRLFASHRARIFDPAARAAGRRLRVAHTAPLSFDASWVPLLWRAERCGPREAAARAAGRRLRVAHTAPLSFDASWVPLLWLLAGHELHVLDRLDPRATVAALAAARVDVLDETPSHLRMLLLAGLLDGPARPRVVLTGGEPVEPDLGVALAAAGVTVHNAYGTTETTVDSLVCPAAESGHVVVGQPVAGTRAQVLDAGLRPAPEGELWLSGDGLTRGYLGAPGATAAAFVADPAGPRRARLRRAAG
ncbi:non-ribosomal peptide synthase, partial [Amycolatopsis vancoresmycina DSM 44592]